MSRKSNFFLRCTTGAALISAMPKRIRSLSSCLDWTRICRRKVCAIFPKNVSTGLSHEPCLAVCTYLKRLGLLAVEMGNLLQGSEMGPGNAFGGGILLEQLEHPASGDVVAQGSELGKGASQEVVQAVDGLSGLLDLGLEASGDLAQQGHGRRRGWGGIG